MRKRGMTLLPYAPLAGGFLSGKYLRDKPLPKDARLAYSSHHASDVINERNWDYLRQAARFRGAHRTAACSTSRSAGCWRGR